MPRIISMFPCILCTCLIFTFLKNAAAIRASFSWSKELPSLAGVWKLPRKTLGFEVRESRFYDVIQQDGTGRKYSAFPLTGCNEGSIASAVAQSLLCDVELTLEISTGSTPDEYQVSLSGADRQKVYASVLSNGSNDHAVEQLRWNNGDVWLSAASQDPSHLLAEWDDAECRELSGPAMSEELEFSIFFGTSASLSFKNIPGITLDNVNCVAYDWLQRHRARFECILKHAAENKLNDTENRGVRRKALQKALQKLEQVMPKNASAGCIPDVCILMSIVKAPIPSPVPTVAISLSWPVNLNKCNSLDLAEEVREMKEQDPANATKQMKQMSKFAVSHGTQFTIFPLPDVAYVVQGSSAITSLVRSSAPTAGSTDCLELEQRNQQLEKDIIKAIKNAHDYCPSIKRRFLLRRRLLTDDEWMKLDFEERLLRLAGSMPELVKQDANQHVAKEYGFGVGGYGMVGYSGFAVGVFGGGSTNKKLGTMYRGCKDWKTVIKLWRQREALKMKCGSEQPQDSAAEDEHSQDSWDDHWHYWY
eukprot:TRINITY_DN20445_c0_g3_i1.p1 TRINITY_DN20445_c0_g3~~TRINITY_DN20445_c0_g3_i1.p1  ORF type:complete len:533 (+),score=86.40 TRINITY_DN20445_c0_g3_i1:52-1650(+)